MDVTRDHPSMDWGAHDDLRPGFLYIWIAHPNDAIGMRLKSCGLLRYAYDDTFGVVFACRSRFTCISVCGIILSHRFSGNEFYTPHKIDLKFHLKFCISFSAKFLLCIPDSTNSYCIPFNLIFSL